jgi:hypothetical protein
LAKTVRYGINAHTAPPKKKAAIWKMKEKRRGRVRKEGKGGRDSWLQGTDGITGNKEKRVLDHRKG